MEKTCTKCKCVKPLTAFSKNKNYSDGYAIYCKPCRVVLNRQQFLKNPDTQRAYSRKWNRVQKQKVFEHYCDGDIKCAKCGFADMRALSLDHVEGGGNKHRKSLKQSHIYRWIVNNGFPTGYQILCMNCQFIKRVENGEIGRGEE